jgi:hypothetical protein
MNERIEKLFEQALEEFKAENKYATIIVPNPLKEKFAELIVRECMGICYRTDTEYEGHKVKSTVIASKVAEHFGVEE